MREFGFFHTFRHYRPTRKGQALQASGVSVPLEPPYVELLDELTVHNLVPAEGINYILGSAFKGQAQVLHWYIGIFEGNYVPLPTDTMATFPGQAIECTSYSAATRPEFVSGPVTAGAIDNSASIATFTMNNTAAKTLYGSFISSSPVKGAVAGTLVSVGRYPEPRILVAGDIWTDTVSIPLVSV